MGFLYPANQDSFQFRDVNQAGLELTILPLPLERWDSRRALPHLVDGR